MTAIIYALLGVVVAYAGFRLFTMGNRHPRMPPGPPTAPIIGNAHQIPTTGLGKKFAEWSKQYGDIFSLKVGPTNIVVLCSPKAVNDLLNKKGSIYSDRPQMAVANFVTHGDHLTLENQGPSWRDKRSIVTRNFNPMQLDQKHFHVQEAEAVVFMNNLLRHPEDIFSYAKLYTASVAGVLIYGHRAKTLDAFWNKDVYDMLEQWLATQEAGANPPVEEFPFLWYLPGSWKKRAYKTRQSMDDVWDRAREIVDARRLKGDKRDCLIDTKLDEYNKNGYPMSPHAFNNLFGELLEAGADTTANQMLTLILALAKYPEFQLRARKEIDAVCGADRAPQFSDFDKLPYVNAIVKEGMRWRPTAHAGLPHLVTKGKQLNPAIYALDLTFRVPDDEYEGMFIPKNTTIFIGIYAMHQNEKLYPEHEKFNPDRFLDHPKLANDYAVGPDWAKRDHYGYGAGRRMCPGIHLAERNMWRITAKLLWAFDIAPALDPVTKQPVELDEHAYTSAILTRPMPYRIRVSPRSDAHMRAIERELDGALEFLKQWD
ncbi:MAG: hypothetical protein M1819_001617 [Sarea resinae]|nr:MAG: hypothetical protein M1819_001617 [Sarea resinae]